MKRTAKRTREIDEFPLRMMCITWRYGVWILQILVLENGRELVGHSLHKCLRWDCECGRGSIHDYKQSWYSQFALESHIFPLTKFNLSNAHFISPCINKLQVVCY